MLHILNHEIVNWRLNGFKKFDLKATIAQLNKVSSSSPHYRQRESFHHNNALNTKQQTTEVSQNKTYTGT